MPKTLTKEESTATDTYAKFIAEPFEAGYGHTVGNSLRRVLLSSLEGASITAVKIAGAQHEFATLPGVVEDLTDIVLNLKKVKFKLDGQDHEPKKLSLTVSKTQIRRRTRGARRPRICHRRGKQTARSADRPYSHRLHLFTSHAREVCGGKHSGRSAYRL